MPVVNITTVWKWCQSMVTQNGVMIAVLYGTNITQFLSTGYQNTVTIYFN